MSISRLVHYGLWWLQLVSSTRINSKLDREKVSNISKL